MIAAYRAKEIAPEDPAASEVEFMRSRAVYSVVKDPSVPLNDRIDYYDMLVNGERFD